MERLGFQVKLANNGAQGVQLFQSWRPHLIWMDRRMPEMDGLEATRRIRELPGGKEVKIVAVTASAFKDERDETIKAGMDDFVRKPYRFNEIYDSLSKQLDVKYIYANSQSVGESAVEPLTKQMFSTLPPELCTELINSLNSLDSDRVSAVIQQVAVHDLKLYKTLSHLAESFDYPTILKALQKI